MEAAGGTAPGLAPTLAGRVVLITGGASGQGRATAELFAQRGAQVVVADLNDAGAKAVAEAIGPAAISTCLDVSDERGWVAAVDLALAEFGHLDGLVNNAGIFTMQDIAGHGLGQFQRVIEVNLVGTFLGIQVAGEALVSHGGGTIVNTSSVSGLMGFAGTAAYTSSKFAIRGLTKVAALELGPAGVRVNCVCPGYVDTPMLLGPDAPEVDPDAGRRPAAVALGRSAAPMEIARVNAFLTSDDSSYCTGADFVVDAGLTVQLGADGRIAED